MPFTPFCAARYMNTSGFDGFAEIIAAPSSIPSLRTGVVPCVMAVRHSSRPVSTSRPAIIVALSGIRPTVMISPRPFSTVGPWLTNLGPVRRMIPRQSKSTTIAPSSVPAMSTRCAWSFVAGPEASAQPASARQAITKLRIERFGMRIVVDPRVWPMKSEASEEAGRSVIRAAVALFHLVRPPVPTRRLWPSGLPAVTLSERPSMRLDSFRLVFAVPATVLLFSHQGPGGNAQASSSVTVREGTSMSVTMSPDRRTLAIDLQGSIWTLPAAGGVARQVTDAYNDARHPTFSPDGRSIAFQGYRAGGYDIWAISPDGSNQRQLTTGPFDDREPAWSHDGTRVAFSSDRGESISAGQAGTGNYNVWILDVRSGALTQVTKDRADDFMPTWSPDDREIAFISTRAGGQTIWSVMLAGGTERRISAEGVRADAPSWGPGGQIVYHSTAGIGSQLEIEGRGLTGEENAFPFRAAWRSEE